MQYPRYPHIAAAGLSIAAAMGLSACSDAGTKSAPSAAPSTNMASMPSAATAATSTPPATALVGPGCEAYAQQVPTGPGSVAGMGLHPVATAASDNPMLTMLTAALSGKLNPNVNLVTTLNSGQYTVFAPTDDAFKKLPAATLDSLKTDSATLTKILTYHVVPGQLSPAAVAGTHTTLESSPVTVTGAGADLKVNDAALVCGGVKTANATVYMIDSVLMPPK
ncbi:MULTISPECIES: fasciclin domain-containing protein [Mycolicibacterium]|uniref:fasciclin domain-containing protein n=1 Tax=Mycolicibacterium TaxID=1866885 RepID=UPI000FB2772F|nr:MULTISPECIES: fasciclin domain-containing protein [Mycolicibacterium]RUP32338.1 MAG: fasciclin domain-containing protein [Mycolicibacterium sp.]UCZ61122.1 fasciclin domain-containing protein [Mycolicibacterium phocaicum]